MTEIPQPQDFTPFIGQLFAFAGHHVTLRLMAIETKPQAESRRTPFTLIFEGPAGDILPEGLHRTQVADDTAGEPNDPFEFYIMPIHTPQRDRQEYQVVFN
ncbi:MAG TPA: hypothetical protein VHU42_19055 [Rhodopila sp.]|nr:hypothetical protein [Rhodopila sp.]